MRRPKENAGRAPGAFPEAVQQRAHSVAHGVPAGKAHAVVVRKVSTGANVIFSTHSTQADAEAACARLVSFGLEARIERVRSADAVPGATLHGRAP